METITSIDIFWFFFSTSGLAFFGVITWLAQRMLAKVDSIDSRIGAIMIDHATVKQEMHDHVKNTGVHCKDGDCQYRRRLADGISQ